MNGKITSIILILQSMKTENPKQNSVRDTFLTLKECSKNKDYLIALEKMETAQKNLLRMLRNDDIEPLDGDIINC